MTTTYAHQPTVLFVDPDGYKHFAPDGFSFATFRVNWQGEWELNYFHKTMECAKESFCDLLADGWTVAIRTPAN
jgi:hypothetical protein